LKEFKYGAALDAVMENVSLITTFGFRLSMWLS